MTYQTAHASPRLQAGIAGSLYLIIIVAGAVGAVTEAEKKLGTIPDSLRIESFDERKAGQTMHIGPYADDAATIADRLHNEFLPQHNLAPNGRYHEIYLNDPGKVAPAKQKTVVRQPVRKRHSEADL